MSDTQTKPPATADAPMTLSDLGARIKSGHSSLIGLGRRYVDHAISIGEDLLKAKLLVGHGNFLKWVEDNCGFADKTAERYMKFAENKDKLRSMEQIKFETISNLTLNAAERLIDGTGSRSGSGGGSTSDAYDRAQKTLLAKLSAMNPETAEAAAQKTIDELAKIVKIKKPEKFTLKIAA
jgi:hypothetical protein